MKKILAVCIALYLTMQAISNTYYVNIPAVTLHLRLPGSGEGISPAMIEIDDPGVTANYVAIHGAAMNSTVINQVSGIDRACDVNAIFNANFKVRNRN